MASAIDKVQSRLQEAMDHGNQASLGQAIDASKGVNGLKQLRRSAKVPLEANTVGFLGNSYSRKFVVCVPTSCNCHVVWCVVLYWGFCALGEMKDKDFMLGKGSVRKGGSC